ncbi:O-succinylbenzoic acid--CoA ligase [Algoriphagus ratkowskyi]|uniref:AMP-binding protein n=1 Tax=Algoriphagus ratkowskyi TaxID=57028 RepID=A0A2W7QXX1_9BACT|nr:AMP-binding protein [Algoriphagus ratkowskyi]PZX52781.1 O-succinylbenzoic acid--CoA ligase [Algoriphagus ratkowskyi]TXD76276.1 AMP-binding protein [Algoriphagus ratkowskyi]
MFQLTFGTHKFQQKEDFELIINDFPDFANAAIRFCHEWLSGENNFTQQTSGSTGTPKNIEISRAQMIASSKATQAFFQTDENTNLLCCLDPSYIAGKMMLVRAMVWNCSIHLTEPKSNPLLKLSTSPDFIAMVPLQVEACLQEKVSLDKLKAIKHLIIGGAAISSHLKSLLIANDIQAYQTYGMTETVSHIALAKIDSGLLTYKVLPGVEFGVDERNALWVKSASSKNKLVQTNDLVELLDKNSFLWLGRVDFVINSGGLKLHPELLESKAESAIQRIFPHSAFFFFGKKDKKLGHKLCLAIEAADSQEKEGKLFEFLRLNLAKYEVPKNIFLISEFIRTDSGKVNRLKTIEKL